MLRHRILIARSLRNGVRVHAAELLGQLASPEAASTLKAAEGDAWPAGLLARDSKVRSRIDDQLAKHGLFAADIVAATYDVKQPSVDYHTRRIADLERRRRQLFQDFEALTQRRKMRNVQEAEVVP
jgi:hypothetical protein